MKIFEFREFSRKSENDSDLVLEFWENFISTKYPEDFAWNSKELKTVPDVRFEYLKTDIELIIKTLEEKSRGFLNDLREGNDGTEYFKFLWRGISKIGESIQTINSCIPFDSKIVSSKINLSIKSTRKSRHPVDTPNQIHNDLDKLFFQKFRRRLRSESIFAFPDKDPNQSYGNPWMVFPIGNYDIFWSNEIADLWDYIDKIDLKSTGGNVPISDCDMWINNPILKNEANKILESIASKYIQVNLDEILENPFMGYDLKEVMIDCNQYCLVHEAFDIPLSFYCRGEINRFFELLSQISK
jgi:hypothetical protein